MSDTVDLRTDECPLSVYYGQSLPRMIAACCCDWINPHITATRFPITETGIAQFDARLFHLDPFISSADAVAAIKTADARHPWMPATIEHLLSFGATYPDEQRRYPIAALGSVGKVGLGRYVPCLGGAGAKRCLYLTWWYGGWDADYGFLAVRHRSAAH